MATEQNSFKIQTIKGDKKYFYNGEEVSKKIFDEQRAAAEQRQTEILGISKEDFKKETIAERKKRMMSELENLAKGGMVRKPRARLDEGGKPIDLHEEWIKLIKMRAKLSPGEIKIVDDLVKRMFSADEDKDD